MLNEAPLNAGSAALGTEPLCSPDPLPRDPSTQAEPGQAAHIQLFFWGAIGFAAVPLNHAAETGVGSQKFEELSHSSVHPNAHFKIN